LNAGREQLFVEPHTKEPHWELAQRHWIVHSFAFGALLTIAVSAQQVLHIDSAEWYKHVHFAFDAHQTIVVSIQQVLQLDFAA